MFFERFLGQRRRGHLQAPSRRVLGTETLESRALAAAVGAAAPLQNPVVVKATPAGSVGGSSMQAPADSDFATNGPNPATSAGAELANPYLGNNPWLDDLAAVGTGQFAGAPLNQPYFTSLQEYAQYEQAIEDLAALQAAQQMAT